MSSILLMCVPHAAAGKACRDSPERGRNALPVSSLCEGLMLQALTGANVPTRIVVLCGCCATGHTDVRLLWQPPRPRNGRCTLLPWFYSFILMRGESFSGCWCGGRGTRKDKPTAPQQFEPLGRCFGE